MKADQDALERRLWAKQEKVKADHERTLQAERDMCVPVPAAQLMYLERGYRRDPSHPLKGRYVRVSNTLPVVPWPRPLALLPPSQFS